MARKDPSQWSDSYRKRMENFFAKNPYGTLTEARRGKNSKDVGISKPKENATAYDKNMYNLKQKEGNITLKEKLGKLSHSEAEKQKAILKDMGKKFSEQYNKNVPGTLKYAKMKEQLYREYYQAKAYGLFDEEDPYGEIFVSLGES